MSKGDTRRARRIAAACALLLALPLLSGCRAAPPEDGGFRVVATFYPVYVFAQNVAKDVPGVAVTSMAGPEAGCLHDYELKTRDAALIEDADALVACGGGMEAFLPMVAGMRDDLPVIEACEGIALLPSGEHGEHGGHDDHEHGDNAHVWLDPTLAARQVQNIAAGLSAADPAHAALYAANADAYAQRLTELDEELQSELAPIQGAGIVTFHEAFDYFARAYGLTVETVIEQEPGMEPGARDLARTCDLVRELGIRALFVEPQYPQRAAETVSRETGAAIYTLDPVVSGDGSLTSYEDAMRRNAQTLLEAL